MGNTSAYKIVALSQCCLSLTILLTGFLFVVPAESKPEVYPDLTCHKGYNATFMKDLTKKCKDISERAYATCQQQCMLSKLNFYHSDDVSDGGEPILDHFLLPFPEDEAESHEKDEYSGLAKMLGAELAVELTNKVTKNCNDLMIEMANVQKLPCEKWGPVYDCVNEALGC